MTLPVSRPKKAPVVFRGLDCQTAFGRVLVVDCRPTFIDAEPSALCPDPFLSFLSGGELCQIKVTANPARDSNRKGAITGI
jgi:hypothetical protein